MRVLLHDNQICERGTTTSMLDYARALRGRGHEVELSYWSESPANVPTVIEHVRTEFPLHGHKDPDLLPKSLTDFDSAYFIKAGYNDGLLLPETNSLIHAVFSDFEPHGYRYVYISQWLAQSARRRHTFPSRGFLEARGRMRSARELGCQNATEFEYLDLIADIPPPNEDMRRRLNLPDDAFVILRFGGYDSFDIPWAQAEVVRALEESESTYFIGLNTKPFVAHERAKFIPMVVDNQEKANLVSMGNVFLTARGEGEAFGVAIAEALQLGIPVLAWSGGAYRNQTHMLRGLGALYRSPRDLRSKLATLIRGVDPASVQQRRRRGDLFRPEVIGPRLEQLLQP
jgi:hypothetical protein